MAIEKATERDCADTRMTVRDSKSHDNYQVSKDSLFGKVFKKMQGWIALEKRNIVPSLVMCRSEKDIGMKRMVEREYCIHPKILFFCYAGCKPI